MGRSKSRRTKNKPPKKRQGRPSIYTDEQLEFLRPFVAVYLSLGHKKGDAFWQSVFPEFFRRWVLPNVDPDYTGCETDDDRAEVLKKAQEAAQNAARIQLKAWFSRQGQQQNKRSVWRKHIERTLRPKKGKPRAFTESTMYKYYLKMDDFKDKIDDAVEDELNGRELASKKVVALYCKVARELWDEEEDDVKERVRAAAAAYDAERISAYERACMIGEMSEEAKAEARANLASALKPWIRQVLEITGCTTGSFLLGLPPNDERPKVRCYTIHVGRTIPARGYQEYNEFDPETYRILMRSFGRFTHQTIDAPIPTDTAAPSSGSAGNGGNQLDGLLTFEHEEINISMSGFNSNGEEPSQSEQARGSDGNSSSTPRINTPAAEAQAAQDSDLPSGGAGGAGSQTETPPSTQQPSQPAPHAPAGSSDPAGPGESQPSTTNAPESAPGNVERARPRPRPVVYDTPATFSTYLINDFPLSIAFRALMQRLPPSSREQRLAIMKQWGADQLKKANNLAESEAGLGPADSARDARVLKELFQYWEGKDGRSKARAPKKPATRKRKRKAPVEEEEEEGEWTDEEEEEDEYDEREDESEDESEEEDPSEDEEGSSSEDEDERGDKKEGDEDEEGGGGEEKGGNEEEEGEGEDEDEDASGSLRRSKRTRRALPRRASTARTRRSQTAATGAAAGPSHARRRGDSATPAPQRDDSPAPQPQTNAAPQGDGRADFEMHEGALDTLRDAQSIAAPHSIHSEAVQQHLPAWMLNCFNNVKDLEHADDHPDVRSLFVKIVETWGEIERTQEYKQHGKQLSSEGRPPDVKAWIARARRTAYRPNLLADRRHGETDAVAASATFDKFRADMKTWWSNVNPAWRRSGDGSFALRRDVGDWSDLYCTGSNGLVSVVKALKWWWEMLEEVDEQPGDRDEWRAAAADVAWAFEQVLALGKTSPSASPAATSSKPPKKRRRT